MAKQTKKAQQIEAENSELQVYREAFFCLRGGHVPVLISAGEDEQLRSVELLGASRSAGGVILQGGSAVYAFDRLARVAAAEHADPWMSDLARKVTNAIEEACR